ncbi:hypothetical protein ACFYWU_41420 [Streptomyces chrestomyceticus]|uniref:hypothetical protein n=1 Tax=Streptomyces chrestomyceticus TaxID=68185 RepID=UPI0036CA21AC
MRLTGAHAAVRRIWTVQVRPVEGRPALACPHCTARPLPSARTARSSALAHLAAHARADALPGHLRTCQCRERGCSWHPRHHGCAGPVLLALTRDTSGRLWRLADTCAACAAATSRTAVVPDMLPGTSRRPLQPFPSARPGCERQRSRNEEVEQRRRVREMLTYLASALPRCTTSAARLLALQCALRCDMRGRVRLRAGLLRGMRIHRRKELWQELAQDGWLDLPDLRTAHLNVRLRDATILDQAPGRHARRRAAHWALRPAPVTLPTAAPPALHLTALALAAHHTAAGGGTTDPDTLDLLCGHSHHQTGELLDRLVAHRTLAAWHHLLETGEIFWQLPP